MVQEINLQVGKSITIDTNTGTNKTGKFMGFVNMGNIAFIAILVHKENNLIPLHIITNISFEHSDIVILQPKIQTP